MDNKVAGIGVKTMKGATRAIRLCFRKVRDHPLLVGMLCLLFYLYISFPFFFSLLLAASPILLCTFVLLGVLLSYGDPNIPQVEIEENKMHESKTGLSRDSTVTEEGQGFYLSKESIVQANAVSSCVVGEETCNDTDSFVRERSHEAELSDVESMDAKIELGDHGVSDGFMKLNDELESDDEKTETGSFDSERVNVDSLDSLPHSPWRRFEEVGYEEIQLPEEGDEEKDAFDSETDFAEGSSPDASIADILPMLDELHPLLDEDAPQPLEMTHGASDAASELSSSSGNSDEEQENHHVLEAEDEEDVQVDKEEDTKSGITWTEEDQKNLMDLGSSEIERNQRLENLIMRRARKNTSFHERNLIDLETSDLPYSIAPISTKRQNPFDTPNDFSENSGLPPIPGSAPSILLNRRNPFDIPYDSGEEKPNLAGDDFHDESTTLQSKEPLFRRHESFNVGPSIFSLNRQEAKMRPYFVPEPKFGEESSYSPFQRQLSEISESKVSETESLSSVEDIEERKVETSILSDSQIISVVTEQEIHVMKDVINEGCLAEPELVSRLGEISEDVPLASIVEFKMDAVSEHVGHGSQSSSSSGEDSLETAHVHETDIKEDKLHSSSSSLSEASERVFAERGESEGPFEEQINVMAEIPAPIDITNAYSDNVPHSEPVYDSSPRDVNKSISSSSISSDVHFDVESGLHSGLINRTEIIVEKEIETNHLDTEVEVPCRIEGLANAVNESIPVHVEEDDKKIRVSHSNEEVDGQPCDEEAASEETTKSPNSDADVFHEASEKLITTPSAEGNISLFYDKAIHRHRFVHLKGHKANSETSLESSEDAPENEKSDMPMIQELDQDFALSGDSPLSPDSISIPSTVSDMPNSHMDFLKEVDQIKEIDGLLAELDHVGDFSIKQYTSSAGDEMKTNLLKKDNDEVAVGEHNEMDSKVSLAQHEFAPGTQSEDANLGDKQTSPQVSTVEPVASKQEESHSATAPAKTKGKSLKSSDSSSSSSSDSSSSDSDKE